MTPLIDDYLDRLDRTLHGPARVKADLLTEARHGLLDAAQGYRDGGLRTGEAERRAVAEFGPVPEIAEAYQVELAALAARRLSVRIVGFWLVLVSTADRMWQGAPWDGPRPSAGYQVLSASLTWLWVAAGVTAGAAFLYLTWAARRGGAGSGGAPFRITRALARGLTGWLVLGAVLGAGLFAWSFSIWEDARTWPPMLLGMSGVTLAHAWLAWTARDCLISTRRSAPETHLSRA